MLGLQRNVKSWKMATSLGPYQIHTEARGAHWVAWLTREGNPKPDRSVILIARTAEEAEARIRAWAEQS